MNTIIISLIIFILTYVIIATEKVNRTVAALPAQLSGKSPKIF
ncbi:MAG: hypothetical protein ACYCXQ_09870 [Candidatus Humimicrobiaceae bacterium]